MNMIWIYILIGGIIGIISLKMLPSFLRDKSIVTFFTVIIVTLTLIVTKYYVTPYLIAETFVLTLKYDNPAFDTISKHYPEKFQAFVSEEKTSIIDRYSINSLILQKLFFLNSLLTPSLPYASSESIYHFYETELKLDKILFTNDPELVLYMEFQSQFQRKPNPTLIIVLAGKKLINEAIQAREDVILSAINHSQKPLTEEEKNLATQATQQVFAHLQQKYDSKTLSDLQQNPGSPSINQKEVASALMSLYTEMLNTGKENIGLLFRK